ncbi:CsbD family protein [Pseudoxanthomonas sangjuensis]|uniref:CsbD family protein n=1 Tax=Pseudoxanthomonas sangjuensis TaxID=1503750 RepID=UPI001391B21C|nr:CsbD family protein [Pseudoxanthomonas sangjuensis]KAF1713900.1 hypothetical protein CSC71_05855 [Pseudoxanthomonas sangjuensis]
MQQDIIAGNWKQLEGRIRAQWSNLTDEDCKVAKGSEEYLTHKLQERYGWDRDRAESEVRQFERMLDMKH